MTKILKRKPLSEEKLEHSSIFKWWDEVTSKPSFFDVLEAARRKKEFKRGSIQDTQHGQNIAAGYEAGFEAALEALLSITAAELPTQNNDQYRKDSDLDESI